MPSGGCIPPGNLHATKEANYHRAAWRTSVQRPQTAPAGRPNLLPWGKPIYNPACLAVESRNRPEIIHELWCVRISPQRDSDEQLITLAGMYKHIRRPLMLVPSRREGFQIAGPHPVLMARCTGCNRRGCRVTTVTADERSLLCRTLARNRSSGVKIGSELTAEVV